MNLEKYREVFLNVFGVDVDRLNDDFTFDAIDDWDSMTHMSLITDLEDAFDVMLETDDILHFGSYLNGIKILRKYGVAI